MMRVLRFKYSGYVQLDSDERIMFLSRGVRVSAGGIAIQLEEPTITRSKEIVHIIMDDARHAYAICAHDGWEPWVEEIC